MLNRRSFLRRLLAGAASLVATPPMEYVAKVVFNRLGEPLPVIDVQPVFDLQLIPLPMIHQDFWLSSMDMAVPREKMMVSWMSGDLEPPENYDPFEVELRRERC